jgi:hypothetical protein
VLLNKLPSEFLFTSTGERDDSPIEIRAIEIGGAANGEVGRELSRGIAGVIGCQGAVVQVEVPEIDRPLRESIGDRRKGLSAACRAASDLERPGAVGGFHLLEGDFQKSQFLDLGG